MIVLEIVTWLAVGLLLALIEMYASKRDDRIMLTLATGLLGAAAGGGIGRSFSPRVDMISPYLAAMAVASIALVILWSRTRPKLV